MSSIREGRADPSGPAVGFAPDRLRAAFTYARVDELLQVVHEALPTDEEQAEQLRMYINMKVQTVLALATALASPEDADELYKSLASLWLELRFEWQRHNNVANFGLAVTGVADPAVLTAAAAISGMLTWLEELLGPDDIECLVTKALGLLDDLRPAVAGGSLRPLT